MTVVADTSGEFADFGPVALNDSNTVAFYSRFDDGRRGIFKISGAAVTNITELLECCSPFSPNVHINNAGTVVFQVSLSPVESAIYTGRGGPLTIIAKSGEEFRRFGGSPWISEHGQVVFSAYAADRRQAVYLANDSSIAKLMEVNGYPYTFPSMSSSGEITFFSDFADTLGRVITRITEGVATTLVSVDGPFERLYVPSTTPGGRYAFMGGLDLGGFGIFTGPDPVKDKVIRTGDPLFGSTVHEVGFYRGLNDRGDVAFRYRLVNGVEGVAVARIVPEPGGLVLVIAALVIVALRAPGPTRPGSLR
ncbi:MAG: hypothetical protein H0W34_10960 [Pyrinomonadaceae bacterium]|nr:hypothetical protein [Pyrinomonadaceae bacterium]